jgi:hypothetical protein
MAADVASAASDQNLEFQIEYLGSSVKFFANARYRKCCLVLFDCQVFAHDIQAACSFIDFDETIPSIVKSSPTVIISDMIALFLWIVADPPWHSDAVGVRLHHQRPSLRASVDTALAKIA